MKQFLQMFLIVGLLGVLSAQTIVVNADAFGPLNNNDGHGWELSPELFVAWQGFSYFGFNEMRPEAYAFDIHQGAYAYLYTKIAVEFIWQREMRAWQTGMGLELTSTPAVQRCITPIFKTMFEVMLFRRFAGSTDHPPYELGWVWDTDFVVWKGFSVGTAGFARFRFGRDEADEPWASVLEPQFFLQQQFGDLIVRGGLELDIFDASPLSGRGVLKQVGVRLMYTMRQ